MPAIWSAPAEEPPPAFNRAFEVAGVDASPLRSDLLASAPSKRKREVEVDWIRGGDQYEGATHIPVTAWGGDSGVGLWETHDAHGWTSEHVPLLEQQLEPRMRGPQLQPAKRPWYLRTKDWLAHHLGLGRRR